MQRVALELLKVAKLLTAKKRPETLFEQEFFDLREEIKNTMAAKSNLIVTKLKATLLKDLKEHKVAVMSVEPKLGRFRGHYFITSCPIEVKADEKKARIIESWLQSMASPKFRLKDVEDGVAKFNVR